MKIFFAIHGSHSQPEQMQAQRDTWLKDLSDHMMGYKFFLGLHHQEVKSGNLDDVLPDLIELAKGLEQYDDIVFGDFPDGPVLEGMHRTWFLNRKTEALCEYALNNGYDYVFKCDDDTYVRTDLLLTSGFEEHDYVGFTDTHYTRELGWYSWAQGGSGYWLSRRAMEIIVSNGLHIIPAEDFAVGNILAAHGIHPHHDDRYIPGVSTAQLQHVTAESTAMTLHKVNAEWMRRLHGALGPDPKKQAGTGRVIQFPPSLAQE